MRQPTFILIARNLLFPVTCFVCIACVVSAQSYFSPLPGHLADMAYPLMTTYDPDDYQAFDQNFEICQDSLGRMYFANGDGALIYDGNQWELVPLANYGTTYSIACAPDQKIFVGGTEEVGYLEADSVGRRKYVSLRKYLPRTVRLGRIRNIVPTPDGIYFHNRNTLFCFAEAKIVRRNFEREIADLFYVNNQLHISVVDDGLFILRSDSIIALPGLSNLPGHTIFLIPFSQTSFLLGNNRGQLFKYTGNKLVAWKNEAAKYLTEHELRHGIELSDSTIALATRYGGIIVLDRQGRIRLALNNKLVLPSQKVFNLYQDRNHLLWAGMDYGISKIEYPSRFSVIDERCHLDGVVSDIIRHKNQLFIATEYGISKFIPRMGLLGPKVELLYETKDFVDDMTSYGDNLLFTTHRGVYRLSADKTTQISGISNANSIQRSSLDSNRIFVGHQQGLKSIALVDNTFIDEGDVAGISGNIYGIVELPSGELWLETALNSIYRVYFPSQMYGDFSMAKVQSFSIEEGLPNNVGRLFKIDDRLYFREIYGDQMFKLDRPTMTFHRDSTVADQLEIGNRDIKVTSVDAAGNIWFDQYGSSDTEGTFVAWKHADGIFEIQNLFEHRIFDLAGKKQYYDIMDHISWRVGKKKIYRHNLNIPPQENGKFFLTINRVLFRDSMLWMRDKSHERLNELPFNNNRFRFEFSCPIFNQDRSIQYQYRLEGFDTIWSHWTDEHVKDYTNLPEGDYTFTARARDMYANVSEPDSFSFIILPPWHRSWWAYIIYIVIGILGTATLVRWRSNQLEKEKQALQQVVLARTSELQVRNQQLRKQKEKLAHQTERLKEVDQLKSRLFANISHEFRTPLTLIKGPLDQKERFPNSKLSAAHFQMMQRNTNRLLRLVNQLLDLSKLDSGSLKINATEGNIYHWIRKAASSFSSLAAERNLDYQVKIPMDRLWTAFDRDHIEKIVYNLLSNAFKFTGHQGSIMIKVEFIRGTLNISVKDSGKGIPATHQSKIFDRFYQIDNSSIRKNEGSGIGLALVKELVELMQGTITLESEIGKGTTFLVRLPIEEIKAPLTNKERLLLELDQKLPLHALARSEKNDAMGKWSEVTVLVVEDNHDMRHYVTELLSTQYSILQAQSGQEGLDKALKFVPDLVVTDLMMPEMDGIQLCKILKSDERTSHVPVVMLTAKAGLESKLAGLETGADSYLTKPFDARELQIQVRNLIKERNKLRSIFSKIDPCSPKEINWSSLDQEFLQKLLNLLEKKYSDSNFVVPQMQKELGMSKTQLHRKMKAITNQAPGEFLRNFRLKRAAQILATGESATQTAYAVGFNNLSYFAKCFRMLHGVNPKEYRTSTSQ